MKQREKYFINFLREGVLSLCFILFFICFNGSNSFSQWKKVKFFNDSAYHISCIYFLNDQDTDNYTCFVGLKGWHYPNQGARLWRTIDGGKTWRMVYEASDVSVPDLTAITFRNDSVGWFTSSDYTGNSLSPVSGCFKTIDGGSFWTKLSTGKNSSACSDVYYNKFSKHLFLSRWYNYGLTSLDDGATWVGIGIPLFGGGLNLNGWTFLDPNVGLVTSVNEIGMPPFPYYRTLDGGNTWTELGMNAEAWQPTSFDNAFYALSEAGVSLKSLMRSDDMGSTWNQLYTFPFYVSGTIISDNRFLYIQSVDTLDVLGYGWFPLKTGTGIYLSSDKGNSWYSICGPRNDIDNRFYVHNGRVWAGDRYGILYENTSGKGSGPRLQIEKNNTTRHITGTTNAFPISFFYSHEAYNESVDSLTFVINYSGAVQYFRDSVCAGWTVIRREITDSTIRFVLKRIDPSAPALDSQILKIYFEGVVAKETTGMLTLDEINFNQDVTFRDCMIASLSKTDSLFVDISDQCGDSTLRQFITTGKLLTITSIRPNPAHDEIEIDLESAIKQNAPIEIFDALGAKVFSDTRNITVGSNNIHIDTKGFSGGMYLLRIGSVSQSFVKLK